MPPRHSISSTRNAGATPAKSRKKSPAPTPSRASANPEVVARNNRYASAWIHTAQASDPVFASAEGLADIERLIGRAIQPYSHCPPDFFPTVALKFGLERYLPTPGLPLGSRGPACHVEGLKKACHKPCLPAFLYTSPKLSCDNCVKHGFPTLIWWYTINSSSLPGGRLSELVPQSCWACYTKVYTGCSITTVSLSEAKDASEYAPETPPALFPLTEEVEKSMADFTPMARTASQAGLESPRRTRSFNAPPTPSPAAPLQHSPVRKLRKGRAYQQELRDRAKSTGSVQTRQPSVVDDKSAEDSSGVAEFAMSFLTFPNDITSLPSTPKPAVSRPTIGSLRFDIENTFARAIDGAERHLQTVRTNAADVTGILDKLFSLCQEVEGEAQLATASIAGVRMERDKLALSMKTMDTRLAEYTRQLRTHESSQAEMQAKLRFLEKHLDDAQRQQAVVDQRMAQAVEDRDRVNAECAELRSSIKDAIEQRDRADAALCDAFAEVDEVKARSTAVEIEVTMLKRRLEQVEPNMGPASPNTKGPLEKENPLAMPPARDDPTTTHHLEVPDAEQHASMPHSPKAPFTDKQPVVEHPTV